MPVLRFLEKIAPTPALVLKLVNLIPPHLSLMLFQLFPLLWSLE